MSAYDQTKIEAALAALDRAIDTYSKPLHTEAAQEWAVMDASAFFQNHAAVVRDVLSAVLGPSFASGNDSEFVEVRKYSACGPIGLAEEIDRLKIHKPFSAQPQAEHPAEHSYRVELRVTHVLDPETLLKGIDGVLNRMGKGPC
jgi:hypothetical protein